MNKNNNNYFSWIIILLLLFLFVCVIFFQLLFNIETYDSTNNTKQSKQNNKLNIIYINLDKREDRNKEMICELEGFSKNYIRLSATDHENGALGCTKSHIRSIQLAIEKKFKHVLIFEDDFSFVQDKQKVYDDIVRFIRKQKEWDVILLTFNREKREEFDDTFDRVTESQTSSAYLVNRKYYEKLLRHFENGYLLLEETNNKSKFAFDIYWKSLQKVDNWYALKIAAGIQRKSMSDVQNRVVDYKV